MEPAVVEVGRVMELSLVFSFKSDRLRIQSNQSSDRCASKGDEVSLASLHGIGITSFLRVNDCRTERLKNS